MYEANYSHCQRDRHCIISEVFSDLGYIGVGGGRHLGGGGRRIRRGGARGVGGTSGQKGHQRETSLQAQAQTLPDKAPSI